MKEIDGKAGSSLDRLRRLILLAFLLALTGSGAELLLLGHTEEFWQYIPIVLMVLSLLTLGLSILKPSRVKTRTFQGVMVLFWVSGVAGLWFHYQANIEFELELYPSGALLESHPGKITSFTCSRYDVPTWLVELGVCLSLPEARFW